jgi:hypothetical protein
VRKEKKGNKRWTIMEGVDCRKKIWRKMDEKLHIHGEGKKKNCKSWAPAGLEGFFVGPLDFAGYWLGKSVFLRQTGTGEIRRFARDNSGASR